MVLLRLAELRPLANAKLTHLHGTFSHRGAYVNVWHLIGVVFVCCCCKFIDSLKKSIQQTRGSVVPTRLIRFGGLSRDNSLEFWLQHG